MSDSFVAGTSALSPGVPRQVPTVEVSLGEVEGDWYLVEYVNSHDGKPTGAHTPYLCPEVCIR